MFLKTQKMLQDCGIDAVKALGINVKQHSKYQNLYGFDYNQFESDKESPIVQECRGLILDSQNYWNIVAFPMKRFFNIGEPCAASVDFKQSTIFEKLDGSCCIVYYYDHKWHVGTRGMPDASGCVNNMNMKFSDLFWNVASRQRIESWLYRCGNIHKTYVFELMTKFNRVVVHHQVDSISLIAVRNNITGLEESVSNYAHMAMMQTPKIYEFASEKDMQNFANSFSGLEHEGFVVCDSEFRRLKCKSSDYLNLHLMKSDFSIKRVVDLIRNGSSGEVLAYSNSFPEWKPVFEKVQHYLDNLTSEIDSVYELNKNLPTRKEFAEAVKQKQYSGVLFGLLNKRYVSAKSALVAIRLENLVELLDSVSSGDIFALTGESQRDIIFNGERTVCLKYIKD